MRRSWCCEERRRSPLPKPDKPAAKRPLLLLGAAGLLLLLAGLALAGTFLPEWRAGNPIAKEQARARFRETADRMGLQLEPGEPRVELVTRRAKAGQLYRRFGDEGPRRLAATRTALELRLSHPAWRADEPPSPLILHLSLDGAPQSLQWGEPTASSILDPDSSSPASETEAPARLLLAPGESLGDRKQVGVQPKATLYSLTGSSGEQIQVSWMRGFIEAERQIEGTRNGGADTGPGCLVFLLLLAPFLVLAMRGLLGLVNGGLLALLTLAVMDPGDFVGLLARLPRSLERPSVLIPLALALLAALFVFVTWSTGESLIRRTRPDLVTGLDRLSRGRLGRREGQGILAGLACGAGLAGLQLTALALSAALPGAWPGSLGVTLPLFDLPATPCSAGFLLAGCAALGLSPAILFLRGRWTWPAAALSLTVLLALVSDSSSLSLMPVHPLPLQLAGLAVFSFCLAFLLRRYGLTALLTACVSFSVLPSLLLAARYFAWAPANVTVAGSVLVAVALLGVTGLRRPSRIDSGLPAAPAFIRRLEEERGLAEMELLARMQTGLLPQRMPDVEGYDFAARSLLAQHAGGDLYDFRFDERGRLWIAAGDVAGHGYRCAIALAMLKAALANLVSSAASPAEVLAQSDRVLRASGSPRNFTSLALVRLDTRTGEATLGNAAHPYPILATGGAASEIELPGLPLGQGPARRYRDLSFHLPPGGVLVFLSDGVPEALDGEGVPYGTEGVRKVLCAVNGKTAGEILEALLADWRRHLGSRQPDDDTTIVVVKRTA